MRSPLLLTLWAAMPSVALAHIRLDSPPPRYADQKAGPCGRGALDARTQNVTTLTAGQELTVTWQETIHHPGHYRISFDEDGQDFRPPASYADKDGGPGVLLDGIADKTGKGDYSVTVRLPEIACTRCTLQLIQVMTDKAPYGDGNDLYFQCADLVLVAPDAGGGPSDSGPGDAGENADAGGRADAGMDDAGSAGPGDGGQRPPPLEAVGGCAAAGSGVASLTSTACFLLLLARSNRKRKTSSERATDDSLGAPASNG